MLKKIKPSHTPLTAGKPKLAVILIPVSKNFWTSQNFCLAFHFHFSRWPQMPLWAMNFIMSFRFLKLMCFIFKTVFLSIIFGNRKRWNKGIVNEMQHFLGIGRTGRLFLLFYLFHPRDWNNWNSGDRFGWTLDFYFGIQWFLFHLNWNRWSLEYLFQLYEKSQKECGLRKTISGQRNLSIVSCRMV